MKPIVTLYTPGNRPEFMQKAAKYNPDGIIIDLEDAVPINLKAKVCQDIAGAIPGLGLLTLVRINNDPQYLENEIKTLVSRHLYGFLLPKAESVQQLQEIDRLISSLEQERNLAPRSIKLWVMIETPLGVIRCYELASAARRIETVVFASAEDGDLQKELKCAFSIEGTEMLYARSKVLLDARAAGLPFVMDGAFSDIGNDEHLMRDSMLSRRLGYDMRTCIHPRQISIVREVYLPSAEEIAYYKHLVAKFEEAEASGLAAIKLDGKLIDYAMYKKARDLIASAE